MGCFSEVCYQIMPSNGTAIVWGMGELLSYGCHMDRNSE